MLDKVPEDPPFYVYLYHMYQKAYQFLQISTVGYCKKLSSFPTSTLPVFRCPIPKLHWLPNLSYWVPMSLSDCMAVLKSFASTITYKSKLKHCSIIWDIFVAMPFEQSIMCLWELKDPQEQPCKSSRLGFCKFEMADISLVLRNLHKLHIVVWIFLCSRIHTRNLCLFSISFNS